MSAEWELVLSILHDLFTSPLTQTLVGAGAGALIAFHRQNLKEKRIELEKNIGLINYSLISLGVNLEKALNVKEFVAKRAKDAKSITSIPRVEEYLTTGIFKIDIIIYDQLPDDLKKYLGTYELNGIRTVKFDFTQTDLYLIQSDFLFLDLPELKDMAGIAKKHPKFFTFAHKSNEYLKELNDTNRKITQCIHKSSNKGDNIQLSFLLSLSPKMEEDLDAALFFMDKCKDMLYKICDETLPEKRSEIHKFTILDKFLKYMPKKDHFPSYKDI